MKPGHLFATAAAIAITSSLLSTSTASAQQQFGPSPQAMYKQHPGSAPTFVHYGTAGETNSVVAVHQSLAPSATAKTTTTTPRRTSVSAHHATTVHRTTRTTGR